MKQQTIMMKRRATMVSSSTFLFFSFCGLILLLAVIPYCAVTIASSKETTSFSSSLVVMNEQDKTSGQDFIRAGIEEPVAFSASFTDSSSSSAVVATIEEDDTTTTTLRVLQANNNSTNSTTNNNNNTTNTNSTNTTTAPTTIAPTESPAPSPSPSDMPTSAPTVTAQPTTIAPTESPAPSPSPSDAPTMLPSSFPSIAPTLEPSISSRPSASPSVSVQPSVSPSNVPSNLPSVLPSTLPSMRPSLVTETSDSFTVQLLLTLNATLNSSDVVAFEQATADWLDNLVVMEDGSLSMVTVTVQKQQIKPVGGNVTSTTTATVNSKGDVNGKNKRSRHHRNLQEQQQQPQQEQQPPKQVYLVIDMDVDATYSGPDANFDLYTAIDPLIQAHDDDWMRNLANAAPVFESMRPASIASIFGDDPDSMTTSSSSGMSTGGYVAVIIVSLMALTLGIVASIFVIKSHRDDVSDARQSLHSSPSPSSYNMSMMMEEYPLNTGKQPTNNIPPPVNSEEEEHSPLRCGQVAISPSSCSASAALDYMGCGGHDDEEEEDRNRENTPPVSPNTMEKGRNVNKNDKQNDKVVLQAGNNNRAAGINLFDGGIRQPNRMSAIMSTTDDVSRQDPPSFSEVDFGDNNRSLFDPVANKFTSSSLHAVSRSHHANNIPAPPSTLYNNTQHHPRDPSDRGIGSKMLHRHPDPITSSSLNPMMNDRMSEASSSWYDNNRPSIPESLVSNSIAARIAQFEKNSDPGSGHGGEAGRELKLTKSSGGTLGATAVDRSAAGTGSDLSSHARDFFSSILGGGGPNNNNANKPGGAVGSDTQHSATGTNNSNSNTTSSVSRKGVGSVKSLHQRKPSYESLLRRGGAGLYDVFAPAGPIGIVVDTTSNGPAVHSLRNTSPMVGLISPGDLIVGLDDEDTRSMTAATLTRRMAQKANQKERKITLLTMDGY